MFLNLSMQNHVNKLSKQVRIVNTLGLHTRAAVQIANIVQEARYAVHIISNNLKADASSIFDILTLNSPQRSVLTFEIDNPSDQNILDALVTLVENGFGEEN